MLIGCCGSMIAPSTDPIGIEMIEKMAALDFDYAELSLAHIAVLPDAEFRGLAGRVERSGLRCEACNNFFPHAVRLTGADVRLPAALDYAARAMERAARLGARIIVFGSADAKNVPRGYGRGAAWSQIVELLQHLGPMARRHGLTIAIEPINRAESNIVNRVAEGLQLMREVNHPGIRLLVDYYHLMMEREDPAIILEAGDAIVHVHFAQVQGRAFPTRWETVFTPFFGNLHRIRYEGRCSIEAFTEDFTADARRALHTLRTGSLGLS